MGDGHDKVTMVEFNQDKSWREGERLNNKEREIFERFLSFLPCHLPTQTTSQSKMSTNQYQNRAYDFYEIKTKF